MEIVQRGVKKCCSVKNVKRRFPILEWLPKYSSDDLLGDFVAGLTVGLTVIPQGIAYAIIAGVPPNYGLYSSFMGAFTYTIFGSCKDITIGPTAIMSILTHEYTFGNPEIATLVAFLSGIIILLFGLLRLGFLITFVSKPVIVGFTSAAAITIATSQVGGLIGISVRTEGFIQTWIGIFKHISKIRWADFALGVSCIIILLLMRKLKEIKTFKPSPDDSGGQKAIKMTIFLISVGRNALVVIFATILAFLLDANQPFVITGHIEPGLPSFEMPKFTIGNDTFTEVISQVGPGMIILPLISILEAIAIGSAFSQGKTLDATQEMIALGLCNLFGSFVHSIPTTGSFSRTAVNSSSGVRTPAGGIVTAVLVILALAVLTPYFQFIPKSALAAVIICAVIFMVEYHEIKPIWKVRKLDQLVLWSTFLVCAFWKLEIGILVGIIINLCILLSGTASPKFDVHSIHEENTYVPYVIVEPRSGLQYVNIDKLRSFATKNAIRTAEGIHPVVIDCKHFEVIDYSAARGIEAMLKDFKRRSQKLIFINATADVQKALEALTPSIEIVDQQELNTILIAVKDEIGNANGGTPETQNTPSYINTKRKSTENPQTDATNPLLV